MQAAVVPLLGRRGEGMRRVVLVLAAMALALLLASGVALAVNKVGTNGPDTLGAPTEPTNSQAGVVTTCSLPCVATTSYKVGRARI